MSVRLLFDENLAGRLVRDVAGVYPESMHVVDALGAASADGAIWQYAGQEEFIVVTKDEDFQRFSVWRGAPPKVIWIRLGNCTTSQVAELLLRNRELIERFRDHEEATFLALG